MTMRIDYAYIEDDERYVTPKALNTQGVRLLTPILRSLEIWGEVKLSSEVHLRFGYPSDGLGFWFRPLVTIRRLEDPVEGVRCFEVRSTYTEATPLVIFRQSRKGFFYETEETCRIVW
jgi:hypothetical protein